MGIRNTVNYIIARIFPAFISMFTVYFYANNVDPQQYGEFAKITGSSSVVYPLIFAPLWYYILRFRLQDGPIVEAKVNNVFWLVAIFAILACVLAGTFLDGARCNEVVASVLMVMSFGNIQLQLESFRINGRRKLYLFLAAARSIVVLLVSVLFVKYNISFVINPIVDSSLIAIMICVLPLNIISIRDIDIFSSVCNAKTIYKFGFLLALYSVLNTALFTVDRVLIAWISSDYNSGLYSAPYDLATKFIHTFVFALELSILPMLINVKKISGDIGNQILTNTKTFIFIMVPLAIGLLSISPAIYEFYFPIPYKESAKIVFPLIVLATFAGGFANAIFHHAYLLCDDHIRLFKTILVVLILNVTMNTFVDAIGFPFYSAYISLFTFLVYSVQTYRYARNMFTFAFPWRFTSLIFMLCLPMIFYSLAFGYSSDFKALLLEIFITVCVYIFGCYVFNVLNTRYFINRVLIST